MTESGTLRERKKQQIRQRILEVCGRLFRARGFDETTVHDIVGEVDVSRQTFFNYFPKKEAVLAELGLPLARQHGRAGARGGPYARGPSVSSQPSAACCASSSPRSSRTATSCGSCSRVRRLLPQRPARDPAGATSPASTARARCFAAQTLLLGARQRRVRSAATSSAEQLAEMYVAVKHHHDPARLDELLGRERRASSTAACAPFDVPWTGSAPRRSHPVNWIPTGTLFVMMVALGMTLRVERLPADRVRRPPWPSWSAWPGQLVLLPAVAFALAWSVRALATLSIGLVLIAGCPGRRRLERAREARAGRPRAVGHAEARCRASSRS